MNTEYIDIKICPKCKLRHRFKLNVERTIVMKMITMSDMDEQPRQFRVTRFFTCPEKNEEFQATFILTDTSWDRIEEVQVVGVANDKNED